MSKYIQMYRVLFKKVYCKKKASRFLGSFFYMNEKILFHDHFLGNFIFTCCYSVEINTA